MPSFNQVVLVGHMTRDVELRYTPSGSPVGDFGLAMNRIWKDKDDNKKEEVCFVDVTVWGSQAENASKYLSKGRAVMLQGYLKLDQWEDKESGQKRSKIKVVAERLVYLPQDGRKEAADDSGEQPPAKNEVEQPEAQGSNVVW